LPKPPRAQVYENAPIWEAQFSRNTHHWKPNFREDYSSRHSQDLREKLLAAVDRGMPRKEATEIFGVSLATLKRWLKRCRETGSAAPKKRPGMTPRVGAVQSPN
jgi:transposase-like protein